MAAAPQQTEPLLDQYLRVESVISKGLTSTCPPAIFLCALAVVSAVICFESESCAHSERGADRFQLPSSFNDTSTV
jgi:hypothetical protein